MIARAAGAAALVLAIVAACTPIEPVPLTDAPINACPCEGFAAGSRLAPRCRNGRCEVPTAANRPEFPFFVVVDVPASSFYAPGATFVFFADETGAPAFATNATTSPPGIRRQCIPPSCLRLGDLTVASGKYRVSAALSKRALFPLEDNVSIPTRVAYTPVGNAQSPSDPALSAALFASLPLAPVFTFPRRLTDESTKTETTDFVQALPSGTYQRVLVPEPPFDALFPPRTDVQTITSSAFVDEFFLYDTGDNPTLDPTEPATLRRVDVERADGLEGWRVWFADRASSRRISTVKTLKGTVAQAQLDTTGERRGEGGAGLGSTTDVVLAPPDDYIAVPYYLDQLKSGAFGTLRYPALFAPVPIDGRVAEATLQGGALLGYSARVRFQSQTINTVTDPVLSLLHYATEVSTDERGSFQTVLPPGTYDAIVEPAEGTGFATYSQTLVVPPNVSKATPTLQPPRRTAVRGRALLVDGRPLAEADVLATPRTPPSKGPKPRPNRTFTREDGRFQLDLDQGPYVITILPKRGSGFPRVVTRPTIPVGEAELPDILIPAPTPLTFTLRDPSRVENPVPNALVRIYAIPAVSRRSQLPDVPAEDLVPVEIGKAVSDANGLVEILLAPGPR